jgi:2'-5' RNA ligase
MILNTMPSLTIGIFKKLSGIKNDQFLYMESTPGQYKLVLLPERHIVKAITGIRTDLTEKYSIENPHTSIPQIILATFQQDSMRLEKLKPCLKSIAEASPALELLLKDFGGYPHHTIYINILNEEFLLQLVRQLRKKAQPFMKGGDKKPGFMSNAHLTIVRKMQKQQFEKAWSEYSRKPFLLEMRVENMTLVRKDEAAQKYMIVEQFPFQNKGSYLMQGSLFI